MKFLSFLITFLTLGLYCYGQNQEKPNVVIIYVDDLGYGDVSCNGAIGVKTPNIDKLAQNGINFTDGHCSAATCTPSRYSLLTGNFAYRAKAAVMDGDEPALIHPGTPTLPSMLKKYGYSTAVIGKWHLGLGTGNVDWNGKITHSPLEIGFDYSYIIPVTGDRVPCVIVENHHVVNLDPNDPIKISYKEKVGTDPTFIENPDVALYAADDQHGKTIVNGVSRIGYMSGGNAARWRDETIPYQMLDKARHFIDESKEEPFFLYFAFHDIHVPRLPDHRFIGTSEMGVRGDAIVQMDYFTGQLVDYIEKQGKLENTLIIFSSDNGPVINDGYIDEAADRLGSHRPAGVFRGGKYSNFEAGTRVPTIIHYPAKIASGQTSDALIGHIDLYASIASLLGHKLEDNEALDSYNMLNTWLGKSKEGRPYLLEEGNSFAIRTQDWKYIQPKNPKYCTWIEEKGIESGASLNDQLYRISADKSEHVNLATEEAKQNRKMAELLTKVRKTQSSRLEIPQEK